jgi:NAD(P)-dependent dehydrogenase (short-subunit alcohol dehydrogenase family)
MEDTKDLAGRVAVVTGGARGVGRGYCRLFAARGAKVVVNDLGNRKGNGVEPSQETVELVAELRGGGGEAVADGHDVSSWSGAQAVVSRALDAFGELDILVCNAGILRDRVIATMSEDEWDAVINVNLKGAFAPLHFAAAHWREKSKAIEAAVDARVILTSSEAGLYGNASQTNYAAAKAGVAAVGVAAARELRRYGIKVNVIAPRARTRLTEGTFGEFGDRSGFDHWDADNVAPWVAYLVGPNGGHISGQTFVVGGGRVELMEGWQRVSTIEQDERWDVSALPAASLQLFGDRKTVPPRFPDMGLPPAIAVRDVK